MKKLLLNLLIIGLTLLPATALAQVTDSDKLEPNDMTNINKTIDQLLPSQSDLFDRSKRLDANQDGIISDDEKLRLIEGDLEQDVAPRVVRILVAFSGLLIMLFFTFAGMQLILSRGNEEQLTKTKDMIIHALIGTAILLGSFAIIVGILRFLNSI